jgi:predicted nucleic acid-binding protein
VSEPVLLDTGPLVAYLDRREEHHAWAVEQFAALSAPLFTCEAVLSEACFLLRQQEAAIQKIGEFLRQGAMELIPVGTDTQPDIFSLMHKYRQVPMAYADACLLWLAETLGDCHVFTTDSDFAIYRLPRARPLQLISPF